MSVNYKFRQRLFINSKTLQVPSFFLPSVSQPLAFYRATNAPQEREKKGKVPFPLTSLNGRGKAEIRL